MVDMKITVVNKTFPGRPINVTIFQIASDAKESYFSAWRVDTIDYAGKLGPIILSKKVQFYIIDKTPDGAVRCTGPIDVEFGQEINVEQPEKDVAPKASVSGTAKSKAEGIKVINQSGNAQPLEMALFKGNSKMVSFKNVEPSEFVYLSIEPTIYISLVEGIAQGEEFLTRTFFNVDKTDEATYDVMQASSPTSFTTEKPEMKIEILQKSSGEIVLSETRSVWKTMLDYVQYFEFRF